MSSPPGNQLLAMLPADDLAGLTSHFTTVELRQGDVLAQPGEEIRRVYFPHSGIVSFMVETADGHVIQTGMIGRDGVIGAPQAIDGKVSVNKIIVHAPGAASVIDRDGLPRRYSGQFATPGPSRRAFAVFPRGRSANSGL